MDTIDVIDRTFLRWECQEKVLTLSKPGHMVGEIYYPAESVTLYGESVLEELLTFVREALKNELELGDLSHAGSTNNVGELETADGRQPNSSFAESLSSQAVDSGVKPTDLQNVGEGVTGNLPVYL